MEPPRVEPPPPPASPFNPTPQPALPSGRSGCPKPLIIGCLAVIVLGGIALIVGFVWVGNNFGRLLTFSLQQAESGIFAQLPQDVTSEERERLRRAFQGARQRIESASSAQEIAEESQQLNMKLLAVTRKGKGLTRQEVQELTEDLEKFASGGSSPPAQP
jgi:hypothetical protein